MDYEAAVAAVTAYKASAVAALSGDAGDPVGEDHADAYKDQVLTTAATDANAALVALTDANNNGRIPKRLTNLGP